MPTSLVSSVSAPRITTAMRGQERRIRVARNYVIGCPRVVASWTFQTDPAVSCVGAYFLGSLGVVA